MGKEKQYRSEYQQTVIYACAKIHRNVINEENNTNQYIKIKRISQ